MVGIEVINLFCDQYKIIIETGLCCSVHIEVLLMVTCMHGPVHTIRYMHYHFPEMKKQLKFGDEQVLAMTLAEVNSSLT